MGKFEKENIILILDKDRSLTIKEFRSANKALEELFELENKYPEKNIVFVRVNKREDLKVAFGSYFSDKTKFVEKMNEGLQKLNESISAV